MPAKKSSYEIAIARSLCVSACVLVPMQLALSMCSSELSFVYGTDIWPDKKIVHCAGCCIYQPCSCLAMLTLKGEMSNAAWVGFLDFPTVLDLAPVQTTFMSPLMRQTMTKTIFVTMLVPYERVLGLGYDFDAKLHLCLIILCSIFLAQILGGVLTTFVPIPMCALLLAEVMVAYVR